MNGMGVGTFCSAFWTFSWFLVVRANSRMPQMFVPKEHAESVAFLLIHVSCVACWELRKSRHASQTWSNSCFFVELLFPVWIEWNKTRKFWAAWKFSSVTCKFHREPVTEEHWKQIQLNYHVIPQSRFSQSHFGTFPKEFKARSHRVIYTPMFITALFTRAKR